MPLIGFITTGNLIFDFNILSYIILDESEKSIFKKRGIGILFSNKIDDVIILFLAFLMLCSELKCLL